MTKEEDKPSATDLELFHKVENSPLGTFRLFRATGAGTEERIKIHLQNLDEITERLRYAVGVGCVIEVISLRLQVIDFWLRIYFTNRAPAGTKREREFGRLLDQCRQIHLPDDLHAQLREFNQRRIDAIHGYVVGSATYSTLEPVASNSDALMRDTIVFVLRNSGLPVGSREELRASPGAMVIHVEDFCDEILSRKRYA